MGRAVWGPASSRTTLRGHNARLALARCFFTDKTIPRVRIDLAARLRIEEIYRCPRTTKPESGHKIYPYLLRGIEITRPNQVWARDITSRCRARLGNPPGAVMTAIDHDGSGVLRRDPGGSFGSSRQAGNLQHRPGLAVHWRGIHRRACQQRHRCRTASAGTGAPRSPIPTWVPM